MSFLNIDEALIGLAGKLEFIRSPIVDMKEFKSCDIGIVEGAVSDVDNVETVRALRKSCNTLIAMGDCAVFGGMTSLRNLFATEDVLRRGFIESETTRNGKIPTGDLVPELLEMATGVDRYVKVDYYIPGCPPDPKSILHVITSLLEGKDPKLPQELLHYDSKIVPRSDEG